MMREAQTRRALMPQERHCRHGCGNAAVHCMATSGSRYAGEAAHDDDRDKTRDGDHKNDDGNA